MIIRRRHFVAAGAAGLALPLPALAQQAAPLGPPDPAAAQREGRLVIYSNMQAENWRPVIQGFNQKHPGIRVETIDIGSREVMERYLAERGTGSATADLLATAQPDGWIDFSRRGEILEYVSPEAGAWPDWAKPLPGLYTISADPLIFLWNNALVPEARRPKSFAQFAELAAANAGPWRNRVTSYGVHTAPFGYAANFAFTRDRPQAWDWLASVAKAQPRFETGGGPMTEKITSGEYHIGYFVSAITIWPRLADPARARLLGWSFANDGQVLMMRGVAIPKGARNINAAKLMLDWIVSKEGQQAFGRGGLTPARPDVSSGDGIRHSYSSIVKDVGGENNIVLVNYDPNMISGFDAFQTRWKSVFGIR